MAMAARLLGPPPPATLPLGRLKRVARQWVPQVPPGLCLLSPERMMGPPLLLLSPGPRWPPWPEPPPSVRVPLAPPWRGR